MDQNELPLDTHHRGVPSGVPKIIQCLWYIRSKPCTYLSLRLTLSRNRPKRASTSPMSPRGTIGCVQNISCPWHIQYKWCTYHASRLKLSPNRPKWASTWPTSPRSTTGCAQNDFWAYGMFGANHAHILRRDWYYPQIDWNELPLDLRHLEVPSGVPKAI
jgi:hypothetical protein